MCSENTNKKAGIIIPFRDSYNTGERWANLHVLTNEIYSMCAKYELDSTCKFDKNATIYNVKFTNPTFGTGDITISKQDLTRAGILFNNAAYDLAIEEALNWE